jgi:hypothetical protein
MRVGQRVRKKGGKGAGEVGEVVELNPGGKITVKKEKGGAHWNSQAAANFEVIGTAAAGGAPAKPRPKPSGGGAAAAAAAAVPPPPPPRPPRRQRSRLRVMSWNIRKLTFPTERGERRMEMLARTVADVAPDVLLVQEVQASPGGAAAIDELLRILRELCPGQRYASRLSLPVPTNRPAEIFAVLWSAVALGGAAPEVKTWDSIDDDPPFLAQLAARSAIAPAKRLWDQTVGAAGESRAFYRAPGFFRFADGLLVVTVHHALVSGSSDAKLKTSSAVTAETYALQACLAAAAAEPAQDVVLCGDFNEGSSGALGKALWDEDGPGTGGVPRAASDRRAAFFGSFRRCHPSTNATNLFGCGAAEALHNDNIWAAEGAFALVLGEDGAPVVHPPAQVQTIMVREGAALLGGKSAKELRTTAFTELSVRLWSDHRPVYCDLQGVRAASARAPNMRRVATLSASEEADLAEAFDGGGGGGAGLAFPDLDAAAVGKLKVSELRAELERRGLGTTGRKAALAERLNASFGR